MFILDDAFVVVLLLLTLSGIQRLGSLVSGALKNPFGQLKLLHTPVSNLNVGLDSDVVGVNNLNNDVFQYSFAYAAIYSGRYATPATITDSLDDRIQNEDDYEYSDDESVPSSHTKLTEANPTSGMVPFFRKANITITTIQGKNAILECPVENLSDQNVVLWYKDTNALTTGSSVLNEDYTLNTNNFSLKIMNVTVANQGEYYCEIQPQRLRLHTTLIVTEDPIGTLIPESSKSSQESIHFKLSTAIIKSSVIGIFLFLRI